MTTTGINTAKINDPLHRDTVLCYYLARMRARAEYLVRDFNLRENSPTEIGNMAAWETVRRRKPFENRQQFEAIFYKIMKWRAGQLKRQQDRLDARFERLDPGVDPMSAPERCPAAEDVARALRRLPCRQHDAILLKSQGLTIEQTAAVLNVSERSVVNDIRSARESMRTWLTSKG